MLFVSGAQKLVAKIKEYNPKIAVFNGKGIYEVFSGQKEFIFGKQPDKITDTETVSGEMLEAIVVELDLKGQCHEIFCLWFFS
jgi:mismatch-specific thymine-DNA glycosylase